MKNLRVRKKLIVSYAVVLGLMIMGTVVSIMNLVSLGNQIQTFYEGPFLVKGSAYIINSNFEKMQKAVYRTMSNTDPEIIEDAKQNAKDAAAAIEEQLPVIEEHFLGDEQIVKRLEEAFTELEPMREHVLALAAENRNDEAAAYMEKNNRVVINKAKVELNSLIENGNQKGEQLISALKDRQRNTVIVILVLGCMSVAISIVFAVYITRGITKPVEELETAAQKLSRGEFSDIKIEYQSEDEFGKLADDMRYVMNLLARIVQDESNLLNEMASGNFQIQSSAEEYYVGDLEQVLYSIQKIKGDLSETICQIQQSSNQVSSGSEQIASSAQIQAQGASEQAALSEEISNSINDLSDKVEENAKNAARANQRAALVGSDAVVSGEHMQDMMDAVRNISRSSNEVRAIIKTIEDIAFQTNILALNAGVEAARAGAAGKGFSVVANEVRSLAAKTSDASKSSRVLIENCIQSAKKGKELASEMDRSLTEVVKGVGEVNKSVSHITTASENQAVSIRQIRESINQIADVIQTNSATVEESAAASEELASQAQLLMELVSHFEVE